MKTKVQSMLIALLGLGLVACGKGLQVTTSDGLQFSGLQLQAQKSATETLAHLQAAEATDADLSGVYEDSLLNKDEDVLDGISELTEQVKNEDVDPSLENGRQHTLRLLGQVTQDLSDEDRAKLEEIRKDIQERMASQGIEIGELSDFPAPKELTEEQKACMEAHKTKLKEIFEKGELPSKDLMAEGLKCLPELRQLERPDGDISTDEREASNGGAPSIPKDPIAPGERQPPVGNVPSLPGLSEEQKTCIENHRKQIEALLAQGKQPTPQLLAEGLKCLPTPTALKK